MIQNLQKNTSVLFVSIEMSTAEIFERIIANVPDKMIKLRRVPLRGKRSKVRIKSKALAKRREIQLKRLNPGRIVITKNRYGVLNETR